ncbi:hypothetical protein Ciccas_013862, partial [Cichlidogyrus casuarinus]
MTESLGNATIHQTLGKLSATDCDLGRNGTVRFRLANETEVMGMDLDSICRPTTINSHRSHYWSKCPVQNWPNSLLRASPLFPRLQKEFQLVINKILQISRDGRVTIHGIVDRERTPEIKVSVIAEDEGTPKSLASQTLVTIKVLDRNDNKPEFIPAEEYHHASALFSIVDPALLLPRNKTMH